MCTSRNKVARSAYVYFFMKNGFLSTSHYGSRLGNEKKTHEAGQNPYLYFSPYQ